MGSTARDKERAVVVAAVDLEQERRPASRVRLLVRPDRPVRLLLLVPAAFLACFFGWPLVRMVADSFSGGVGPYREVLDNAIFRQAVLRTLEVAAICTVVCLVMAYPIAYEVTRPTRPARKVLLGLVFVTLWVSILIRSFSWVMILQNNGIVDDVLMDLHLVGSPVQLEQNTLGVTIAMVSFLLPYMVAVLVGPMTAMDTDLLRASHSLGAGRWRTAWRVTAPLTRGGMVAGVLLIFILSLGFFVIPSIVGGPGVLFVSNVIQQQVGISQDFAAASATGVLVTVVALAIYWVFTKIADPTRVLGTR